MVKNFPITIDWTDKTLTHPFVLIRSLSPQIYFEFTDKMSMQKHLLKDHPARRAFLFLATMFCFLSSCVSVKVPFGPVPKSEKVSTTPPKSPFTAFVTSTADEAWISEKTGNTISYLSECKDTPERPEDVVLDAAKVIDQSKIIHSQKGLIDSRESSELIVVGKVDSHRVKMAIAVFKSGNCMFSLTYGGLEEKFDSELKEYESFKIGFRAP